MKLFIAKKKNHEFCCLMLKVKIPTPVWNSFTKELITPDDIFDTPEKEYGLETRPHITILYGLVKGTNLDELKRYLPSLSDIKICLTNISFFNNENYDVMKFDVESEKLHQINKTLCDHFEYKSDYDNYVPHMTIAYLKKGRGKRYNGEKFRIDVEPESYWFNDKSKDYIFEK